LRGLHFQKKHPQGKLVRVVSGEIFDVAVDLRKNSKTYGQWVAQVLSAQNRKQLWVPEGFAHGFLVLSEVADVLYKVTRPWVKDDEESIIWNDEDIGISWPIQDTSALIISAKDLRGKKLSEL
jgi:dTDP-4-dehydrorhamnose 3,5-epimerase